MTAHVVLITEDREITVIADFTIALDAAIEQGRLQECLSIVNPSLNVFLYKGDFPSFPTATPSTMPPSSPPPTPTILTLPPVPPPTPTQPSITTMPTQQPSENVVTDAPTAVPSHQPTQTITDPPTQGLVCDVLNTPLDGTAGQQVPALVFDMNALSDIDVKELSLHLKAESDLVVEIWTKEGTWSLDGVYPYVGTAWDRTGWTQVKSAVGVTGSGPSQLTKIGAFDSPVSLTAGSVQSFYIWTNSNNGLIKDITNGGIQAANSDLSIEFGAGFYIKPDSNPASGSLSIWGNGFEFEGTIDYCINNGAVGKKSLLPPLQELFLPPPLEELYQSTHQHQTSSLQNNTCYESLTCGQNTEGYNICLDMDVDEDTRKIALQAAERWTSIITGDLPPVNTSTLSLDATNQCSCGAPAVIDDLYLCIREGTMDGACDLTAESGCILGTGGFNNLRSDSQIPVSGVVTIDSADLVYLKANPDVFNDVMTHEIGHALGIGTLWERLSLRSNNTYIGKNAVDVWRKQYGCTDLPPLGSSGHWDEACFTDELMSPVLTFEDANPITKISVGALEDIGYIVDYTKAEDLTNNSVNKTACCNTRTGLRGFGENGHRNLLKKAISNLGEDDSTEKPSGISAALYSDAKEVAMKQLRKNRENAPKIRDDAGTLYVGDLFMHVYVLSNEGGFGSLGFVLPMDEDGGNP